MRRARSWAASPAETARACEAVITCLPSVPVTTRVVEGENGLVEGFAAGDTWIDMSTNDVHETRRLAALLAEKGVQILEAPVTGGVHNASSGTITVLVSGDEATFEKFRDIFHVLGGRVFYFGELGKAHVIKVLSNMLAFIHIAASAEAFMLAKRSGIDLQARLGGAHQRARATASSSRPRVRRSSAAATTSASRSISA